MTTTRNSPAASTDSDARHPIVSQELAAKVAPPPYVTRWTERLDDWPHSLPQLWALRVWAHLVSSCGLTAVQVGHMLFRDQLIDLFGQWGVPSERQATFRDRHERIFGSVYDGLRRAHWYI
jgi:hypothetical protein